MCEIIKSVVCFRSVEGFGSNTIKQDLQCYVSALRDADGKVCCIFDLDKVTVAENDVADFSEDAEHC